MSAAVTLMPTFWGQTTGSKISPPQYFWLYGNTSREVNEARGGLILAAGRVPSKKTTKRLKNPAPP